MAVNVTDAVVAVAELMRRIWMMAGGVGVPGGPMALAALLFFLSGLGPARGAAPAPKLNVVLILADDFGWTDLACYGSKLYETPNIDRLARDGVRFNQAYSACTVCSPTRAALLTGKYPARLHITDWIPGLPPENPKLLVPDWTKYLPLEEKTIADAFRAGGYATASMGNWHLGGEAYFAPYNIVTLPEGPEGEYLTDRLGVEAGQYLEQHKDKPFFLYLPHFAVHLPVQGKPPVVKKYQEKISRNSSLLQTNAGYAAMVESLDDAVGAVRRELDELKLADHTVVIFASDNGGRVPTTSNLPLRVGKGSGYEGGTRVPLIIYWPGVTKAGSVCGTPVISMDLYPTLLEMVGEKKAGQNGVDDVSLVPLLR
ncbi:MAG: sulfatase, partial [Verrucomicrobia bacterium]